MAVEADVRGHGDPAPRDRFGIGYRPETLAGILTHTDEIDVVEAIADDFLDRGNNLRALRTLARQVPLTLHGVSLGLAGASPVSDRRLDNFARWVGTVEPESWTEHLAFVRAGGIEVGHLAAPPRRPSTVENAVRNTARAARVVGSAPCLENIATLVDPPCSTLDEAEWVSGILRGASTDMLLDLHNLHANSQNFGFDPRRYLDSLPPGAIRIVHLAGGRPCRLRSDAPFRIVDDHLHDVPDPVFALLSDVAERASGALTVILERDGNYPAFEVLLGELRRAREAVRRGRERSARVPAREAA